jgi:multiple sugar transport system substrate-binding protein
MKKLKKTLLMVTILIIVLGSLLSACGSNEKTSGSGDDKVIRFLHNETDTASVEFFNAAIKQYEADNPGIKIQMEAISTDGRHQKLNASFATKTAPEIFKILPEERFNFSQEGYIVPLDGVVEDIGKSDFVEGTLISIDGKVYDLPYTLGNWGTLWYREDLLKSKGINPPTTWEELIVAAKSLTEDTDGDGTPDVYGIVFPAGKNRMTAIWFSQILWSAGGTYFDENLNVSFNSPETIKALKLLKELQPFAPPGISSYSYGEMVDSYLSGKVALDLYAARLVDRTSYSAPDLLEVTKAAPMPVGPTGAGVKMVSTNSFAISSPEVGAKNQDEAKKFLKYLITGERLKEFSYTAFPHLVPPLKSIQKEMVNGEYPERFKGRDDLVSIAFDTSSSTDLPIEAGMIVNGDGSIKFSGQINPYIGSVIARDIPAQVVQMVLLKNISPEEAAKWGQEEMEKIVAEIKN